MIFGNRVAKMKLVEQLTLVTLQTAHHGSTSPRIASTQRNHASRPVSTDFCNKIGTKRTCREGLTTSARDDTTDRAEQAGTLPSLTDGGRFGSSTRSRGDGSHRKSLLHNEQITFGVE